MYDHAPSTIQRACSGVEYGEAVAQGEDDAEQDEEDPRRQRRRGAVEDQRKDDEHPLCQVYYPGLELPEPHAAQRHERGACGKTPEQQQEAAGGLAHPRDLSGVHGEDVQHHGQGAVDDEYGNPGVVAKRRAVVHGAVVPLQVLDVLPLGADCPDVWA